jgi:uncharacterized repeat protein (TIGR03803 family)
VSTAGKERTLYDFSATGGSANPNAALTIVKDALYGTSYNSVFTATRSGNAHTLCGFTGLYWPRAAMLEVNGMMYGTTGAGKASVLYSFQDVPDGRYPLAGLIDVNGTLYGTTASGGTDGDGTVFAMTP